MAAADNPAKSEPEQASQTPQQKLVESGSELRLSVAVTILGGVVPPMVLFAVRRTHLESLRAALDILQVRKTNMTVGLSGAVKQADIGLQSVPARDEAYFSRLVDINVQNLGSYYSLVRLHNDKSFSVSVWVGIFGFILILLAVGFALSGGNQKLPAGISAGSGVITEFISAVFFYLYNRSVREMRDYFDSLLTVQNILLSLKLVTDTKDKKEKAKMVGLMLSYLVDRKTLGLHKVGTSGSDDEPKLARRRGVGHVSAAPAEN